MTGPDRERAVTEAFVDLASMLVAGSDPVDMLSTLAVRCTHLLNVASAGLLLADPRGTLHVLAASSESTRDLELFQLQRHEGPCLDCFHTGEVVRSSSLDEISPWPRFAAESVSAGFPSVCAVPLRLKELILGCLNLFMSEPVGLSDAEVSLAQALADVASIAIVQDQASRQAAIREGHLQHALTSRISIEQAKGMVSERGHVDMDEAFTRLRSYARNNNRGLTEVAESLVAGRISVESVSDRRRTPPPPPAVTKKP